MRMLHFSAIFFLLLLSGCGYTLRGQERPFFKIHDLKTLHVYPVRNNSYKAGVDITFYNALRKRFSQGGYVQLVDQPENADATIQTTISEAVFSPLAVTTVDKIASSRSIPGPSSIQIASSYQVKMSVQFELKDRKNKVLWKDVVAKNKSFPASNYLGALGSTSALINEGEFERNLSDLSSGIAIDAEESINALF